jgi:hypothetical protein
MINQLFRAKFESNLVPFIVFLGLNALVGFVLVMMSVDFHITSFGAETITETAVLLLSFCFVAGGLSLLRYNRERSSRLYAQLPVTSLQVRVAYWCHACLYLCISSLVLLMTMLYAGNVGALDMLRFTLLYFFHAGVLLGAISIVTSNTLRLIPDEVRKSTVVYFFLATFITFLFLVALVFIVVGYIRVTGGGVENWTLLTLIMMLLCVGLVALDIQLFRNKDSYLD